MTKIISYQELKFIAAWVSVCSCLLGFSVSYVGGDVSLAICLGAGFGLYVSVVSLIVSEFIGYILKGFEK